MADMEVDPPVASTSGPSASKKKKQEGPRFEVKKVRSFSVAWDRLDASGQ
jgi:hypothetical protein